MGNIATECCGTFENPTRPKREQIHQDGRVSSVTTIPSNPKFGKTNQPKNLEKHTKTIVVFFSSWRSEHKSEQEHHIAGGTGGVLLSPARWISTRSSAWSECCGWCGSHGPGSAGRRVMCRFCLCLFFRFKERHSGRKLFASKVFVFLLLLRLNFLRCFSRSSSKLGALQYEKHWWFHGQTGVKHRCF